MGSPFLIDLEGDFYRCKQCQSPFAFAEHLISKDYHCSYGRAYHFVKLVNVSYGERQEEMIIPRLRSTVIEIYCIRCGSHLGWKYESVYEENQMCSLQIARSKILEPGEVPDMPPPPPPPPPQDDA